VLEVFVRDGCPHCADAKAFLPRFASERPWLNIVYRAVDVDSTARDDLIRYSRASDSWPPGVPTFMFNRKVLVVFESAEHNGARLAAIVDMNSASPENIDTELFGTLSVFHLVAE
jgi:glutaredoxin